MERIIDHYWEAFDQLGASVKPDVLDAYLRQRFGHGYKKATWYDARKRYLARRQDTPEEVPETPLRLPSTDTGTHPEVPLPLPSPLQIAPEEVPDLTRKVRGLMSRFGPNALMEFIRSLMESPPADPPPRTNP
jgi:hypothetical protein